MKRFITITLISLLVLVMQPAPAAVAGNPSSICHFESFTYAGWPGGGNIDSGISVGLSRQMRTFGPSLGSEACSTLNNDYMSTVRQSVAHQGGMTWMIHGSTIPDETVCLVKFSANGKPWFEQSVASTDGFWVFYWETESEHQASLKPLLHLGKNTLSAQSDCTNYSYASMTLNVVMDVHQDSFGEFSGVSVNDGADFTNTTDVVLNLSFDGVIAQVAVSNDGGFAKAHTQIFDYQNNTITWKLRSSATKLPRKVYVRYRSYDAANDSSYGAWNKEVYSDDIILDEVAPTISVVRASVSTGRPAVKLESRGYLPGKINTVRVTADDDRSGVAGYQVSAAPRGMRVYFVKTSNFKVMIPFNRKVLYVRAVDGAGNHGVWRQVSTK